MHEKFGVQVNVISAGRPQANGQAESMVQKMKEKMRALMIESCDFSGLHISCALECKSYFKVEATTFQKIGMKLFCTLQAKLFAQIQALQLDTLLLKFYWQDQ